jgi:hypothetical protein
MSWKLVQEVLDHCPTLTYRQFRVLVALALDTKPETRQCAPGMEKITLQGDCRSMRTAEDALRALRRRGLIKTVEHAAPGRRAVYEILPLGERPRPRTVGERPRSKAVGVQAATPTVSEPTPTVSAPKRPRSRTVAPTYTPTSYTYGPPSAEAAAPPGAQALIAEWVGNCAKRPPKAVIGQVGKHLAQMLADGTDPADIRRGLAAWQAKGLHPATLPSVVNEVMNGSAAIPPRWAEDRARYARWMERARARDAAEAGPGEQP